MRPPVLMVLPLLLGAVAALAQDSATGGSEAFEGRMIARIDFSPSDQPLPRPELDRLLPLHVSSPLRQIDVRQALQKLFDTGRFSDVSIDAVPLGDGVALRISTELAYFVGGVSFDGVSDPPNRNQLLTATKLELGTPFVESQMSQAVGSLQERLRANGLYRATVHYVLERDAITEEVGVHFQLDTGPRARFDGVQLSGKFERLPSKIIRATRYRRSIGPIQLPGWSQATEERVQTGVERVRRDFQNQNRLQVKVSLDKLEYHDKTNTVTPVLIIDNGPLIQVSTIGAKVSQGRLRQLIPIYQERAVDRGLLLEGSRNLVDYFQSQGYFDAAVDFSEESPEPGVQQIDYAVTRNTRHRLVGIEITGNHFFDVATIRERLSVRQAGLLRNRYGRYSRKLRDSDRDSILDLYRSNGFRDVQVAATTLDDYRGHQDDLGVRYEIEEGKQWTVNQLMLEGVSEGDAAYLRTIIQSSEGQAFSEASIAADRDAILAYFFNNGYSEAAFDWSQTSSDIANRANLHYTIRLGQREFVRDLLVRGLETTRPNVVRSRILIHPGDPISQSRIGETQQKLYDLGIFAKVQTALQNPDGAEESKYVLFQLDEAARYSFNIGVGAELGRIGGGVTTFDAPAGAPGFSPRLTGGISRLNFLGLAQTLSLQGLVSTFQQRGVLSYVMREFTGNQNLTLTLSGLFDNSTDIRTFAAQRAEAAVQLAQRLSRANSLQYRFAFRHVIVSDPKIEPQLIPLLAQPVRVGLLSVSYIHDRRDNPTESRRGVYNTVDVGVALPQFASQTDYSRLVLRNSTYHPLSRSVVLARTLQFGYIQRLGGVPIIPLGERFFGGGASSQRAFPDNQAGPRDTETGFPVGGNALLFHSTELRFPLIGDNIGGVFFHDMGNIYSDINQISFGFRQGSYQNFNYMVQAVGFGIRYKTPVGPVRLDFSYSPNSPRFVGFSGTRDQLLLCNPNDPVHSPDYCVGVPQRINTFQFHFSLGQTF
ncbi:MAG TPA: BamA/TamA family outer membrane protein [Bryobacteraceae bacterium]|nr:BamA/TamA family outer membrane protein [Bryobacteraceae bacterium]